MPALVAALSGKQIRLLIKIISLLICVLTLICGCQSNNVSITNSEKGSFFPYKAVDPNKYEVNSADYPVYRIARRIPVPPADMTMGKRWFEPKEEMRVTDVWKVTHVYGGLYYIFSEEYQKRQENLIKERSGREYNQQFYFYHLPIEPSGKIVGGWVSFENRRNFDRAIPLDPMFWKNAEWDSEPSFIKQ